MAETETPITTTETALVTTGPSKVLLERWLESDVADLAIKKIEAMVRALDKLTDMSIRRTFPSDWVIHRSRDAEGTILREVGYLQDCGADRAAKPWGIEVGEPTIEPEEFTADGTIAYHMSAEAWSKVTGERIERVEGSRWSGDPFFKRGLDEGEKPDPTDVRKAAYANLHGRAVRALAGLTAVPVDKLRECGLDVTKCVYVGYEKGARGGESAGAGVGSDEPTVAFGRSAGKKPSELDAKDLDWYLGAYAGNVKDPEKARYRKANQRVLDALLREKEKRDQAAAHTEATGTAGAPEGSQSAPQEKTTSAAGTEAPSLGDHVWNYLTSVAGQKAIPLLRKIVKEQFSTERQGVTDCTEAELAWVAKVPEDVLKGVLEQLNGKKK